ncbi:MAG: hypothetical protein IPF54_15930 [Draconibacterium sp.]|nr:hypothetical protein [Draconibacterium sp.]
MFDAKFSQSKFFTPNAKPVELTKTYNIIPETVWIHGKVFSADVPDEYYCGLRVKGGTILLDVDPFMLNNHVTVSNATKITVNLNLEQNDVFDNDPASPYGVDARNASFNLPANFQFTFKNNVKTIVALGNSKWNVYGQKATLFIRMHRIVFTMLLSEGLQFLFIAMKPILLSMIANHLFLIYRVRQNKKQLVGAFGNKTRYCQSI